MVANPEILNRETVKSERKKPPTIQINKEGQLRFAVEACILLGLNAGDKIEFLIHKEDTGIIYFTKSESGFELKKEITPGGKTRLLVLCRPLAKRLINHFSLSGSRTFDVTNEISDYYGRKCWFILKKNNHIPVKWKNQ